MGEAFAESVDALPGQWYVEKSDKTYRRLTSRRPSLDSAEEGYETKRPRFSAGRGVVKVRVPVASVTTNVWAITAAVERALRTTTYDFRTPKSLAVELERSEPEVREALRELGDRVRRPLASGAEYQDWYRLVDKGRTRRERLLLFRAIAGRDTV
jgi:hypothetical protein